MMRFSCCHLFDHNLASQVLFQGKKERSPPRLRSFIGERDNPYQLTNVASRLIFAFSTLETGQPSLALLLSSSN